MNLTVMYKGVAHTRLNARLVVQKGLSEGDVEHIKRLHITRLKLEDQMREAPTEYILKGLYKCWLDVQHLLQDAWGFPRDDGHIKFWAVPQCTCPKMDNEDAFHTGRTIVNCSCPVHGD